MDTAINMCNTLLGHRNETEKMKAISYLRFSTPAQALGNSEERQISDARKYCLSHNLELDEELSMDDKGLSGFKGHNIDRGSLGHFLVEVQSGKIEKGTALIVEDVDRLTRQGIRKTTELLNSLTDNGIEVHIISKNQVLKPGFNDDPMDIMQVVFRAHLAKEESVKKAERIQSAKDSNKEKAKNGYLYTSKLPIWLTVQDGKIVKSHEKVTHKKTVQTKDRKTKEIEIVDQIPVSTVKEMFSLASVGVGVDNICRALKGKVPSRGWAAKTLSNRALLGEFTPKGCEVIPNYFPVVISQSEWNSARQSMEAKRRNGKWIGGNHQRSDTADNLFSGLMFDITSQPERAIHFQSVSRGQYLMSAFDGRKQNRMNYKKLEEAILGFLSKEDWIAIAGESESEEYKTAKDELNATLSQLDKVARHIELMNKSVEGEDIETIKVAIRAIAKDETLLATLTEQKDALQSNVDSARAKSASLYESETLLKLIKENLPALRLKMRSEIQKRVSRIELIFMPHQLGVAAIVQYSNGVLGSTMIFGESVGDQDLRAKELPRIERSIIKPEFGEAWKQQLLALAQKMA